MTKKSIFLLIIILISNLFLSVNAELGIIEVSNAIDQEFMSTENLNSAETKKQLLYCMVKCNSFSDKTMKKILKSKNLTFSAESPITYVAPLETVICRVKISTGKNCYFATIKQHSSLDGTLRIASKLPCSRKRRPMVSFKQ